MKIRKSALSDIDEILIIYEFAKNSNMILTIFSKVLICRYSLSLQAFSAFCVSGDTHIFS